jgi:hypothetical protein
MRDIGSAPEARTTSAAPIFVTHPRIDNVDITAVKARRLPDRLPIGVRQADTIPGALSRNPLLTLGSR